MTVWMFAVGEPEIECQSAHTALCSIPVLQEGSIIVSGASYDGVKDGKVDWYGVTNIYFIRCESSITLQVLSHMKLCIVL